MMDWTPGYREWAPPAPLRDAIACLWLSVAPPDGAYSQHWAAGAGGPKLTLVLPDACSDLIWQSGVGAFVAGPDTGPVPTRLPPGAVLVGARFWPWAGGPALGVPLAELLDQRVDAASLPAVRAERLPGSLPPALALSRITEAAARMVSARPSDALVRHTAALLARTGAVGQVAAGLGISERQLRRRFEAAAGLRPAALRRVLRFRRFVSQLDEWLSTSGGLQAASAAPGRAGGPDLAEMAIAAGYADQPHLTRECTRLAGVPPGALARLRGSQVMASPPGQPLRPAGVGGAQGHKVAPPGAQPRRGQIRYRKESGSGSIIR